MAPPKAFLTQPEEQKPQMRKPTIRKAAMTAEMKANAALINMKAI
jgi:hypothetical protein